MEALIKCLDLDSGHINKPVIEIMKDLRDAGGIKRSEKSIVQKVSQMQFSTIVKV